MCPDHSPALCARGPTVTPGSPSQGASHQGPWCKCSLSTMSSPASHMSAGPPSALGHTTLTTATCDTYFRRAPLPAHHTARGQSLAPSREPHLAKSLRSDGSAPVTAPRSAAPLRSAHGSLIHKYRHTTFRKRVSGCELMLPPRPPVLLLVTASLIDSFGAACNSLTDWSAGEKRHRERA